MNKEKYSDPTADQAIAKVTRDERRRKYTDTSEFIADESGLVRKMKKYVRKNESGDRK